MQAALDPATAWAPSLPIPDLPDAGRRGMWNQVRKLLAIRLDNLGDVLMTTPALRAMRESMPACRLILLASPAGARLCAFLPEVDQIIAYDPSWMKASAPEGAARDRAMLEQLRAEAFDGAVIFTSYSQSPLPAALLCSLAGIRLRLAHCHENPYQLLSDWIADPEPHRTIRHEVQRQLDLVATLGWHTANRRLAFTHAPGVMAALQDRLAKFGIDPARGFVVLHPGATASSRRYPAASWSAVAEQLAGRSGRTIVWSGDGSETDLVETIRAGMKSRSHSLAGALALEEFAALLAGASVLVCNNSGPVHLAAAVGTPVVDLYALTNPQHTPWGVPNRVLFDPVDCSFCYRSVCSESHHGCLRNVTPQRVVDAALELLDA